MGWDTHSIGSNLHTIVFTGPGLCSTFFNGLVLIKRITTGHGSTILFSVGPGLIIIQRTGPTAINITSYLL